MCRGAQGAGGFLIQYLWIVEAVSLGLPPAEHGAV